MPPRPNPLTVATLTEATLTAEHDFVRRLARSLLRDANDAEDIAQQAWIAGRDAEPQDRRGFFRSVVHNLARNFRRDAGRRTARERAAAKSEALPSTADLLAFEAQRKTVVDAVLALAEPYRGTIVAVYFENRRARDIARELGLSSATVRSRLHRAHEMLREHLARVHDEDGGNWILALTPLVGSGSATTWFLGSAVVKKSLAAAALVTIVAFAVPPLLPEELDQDAVGTTPPIVLQGDGAPAGATGPDASIRDPLPRPFDAIPSQSGPELRHGRLVHSDGKPAGDLPYWFESAGTDLSKRRRTFAELAADGESTGADGSFTWPGGPQVLWIRLDDAHDLAVPITDEDHGARILLPPRSNVAVRFVGVAPDAVVSCEYLPAWSEPDGSLEQAWTWATTSHVTGRLLYFHRRRAVVSGKVGRRQNEIELQIPAWLGFYYHLRTSGEGVTLDVADQYARAPARVVRSVTGAVDTVSVRLFEPDGETLTTHEAYVLKMSIGDAPRTMVECENLSGGQASLPLDWAATRAQALLRVLVDDGESFERSLAETPRDAEAIDFVRGTGKPPLRLELPGGDWPHVYLQSGGRVRPLLRLRADTGYFQTQLHHLVTRDGRLLIPGLSVPWTRVYAIDPDGRVAIADQRLHPTTFRVLPQARRLEPISIEDVAQRYPESQGFQLRFQVQPIGLPEDQWLEAGIATWSRELHNPPIVWRKFVTDAAPYRFVLRTDDDRRERVIDLGR